MEEKKEGEGEAEGEGEGEEKKDEENVDPDNEVEIVAAEIKKSITRKKMIVRKKKKKKKKEPEVFVKEELFQEKAVQMPEWTEALEIEYMNQDQLKRVIAKLREEGLSEEDLKLGEDLYYARATFKVDQFVKLCEVR